MLRSFFKIATVLALAFATAPSGHTTQNLDQRKATGTTTAPPPSSSAPVRDLSGVWMIDRKNQGFTNYTFTDPKTNPPSLTPWGEAKLKEAKDSNGGAYTLDETNDPVLTKCYPPGLPRVYFHPYPFEFVQTPKYILMLFEYDHIVRRIYIDGRSVPTDPDSIAEPHDWMGYSVGHWDADSTLVVDTVGFNEKTWLDRLGHAHSNQLHVVERFHRIDSNNLELGITMIDPKALAKPWTTTFYYQLRPAWELGEVSCSGEYLDFKNFEK